MSHSPSPSSSPTQKTTWQQISTSKKSHLSSQIPQEWKLSNSILQNIKQKEEKGERIDVSDIPRTSGILNEREIWITEGLDATGLAEGIRQGGLKCREVGVGFCKRAAIAHQLTSCLTEIFFDDAIRRAEYLDHYLEKYGEPIGPLHGVPVSVKDTFQIPGLDAAIGFTSLSSYPPESRTKSSTSTSPLISLLVSAGAVLYVKTSIPQFLAALDSHNNLLGRVLNPLSLHSTAGGSSGGEGALVGIKGSPLGIGTDVGGSIRVPAMCQGLYSLKPSQDRIPYAGQQGPSPEGGQRLGLMPSAGPIARSCRDLELFMKAALGQKPWELDPAVLPARWEDLDLLRRSSGGIDGGIGEKKKTVIGILPTDGLITPLPPTQNLLKEVAATLSTSPNDSKIQVVQIAPPPSLRKAQSLANSLMGTDGGNSSFDLLEAQSEPLSPWLQGKMKRRNPMTLEQIRQLQQQRTQITKDLFEMWKNNTYGEIDAIICPIAPHPVPPHDRWNGVSYTSSFVLVDYPAGTLPIRWMSEEDINTEFEGKDKEVMNSWDRENKKLWNKESIDRDLYLDTPLSVQVLVPKLQEKRLVRVMGLLDEALGGEGRMVKRDRKGKGSAKGAKL